MIFGYRNDPHRNLLLPGPVWAEVWQWIDRKASQIPDGIYPLRGDDLFVNVHGYTTLPPTEARFESHRRYVDLQYMIEGQEYIDCHPTGPLSADGSYDEDKDLLFHRPAQPQISLPMTPGAFAVFYPEDAHRPKVHMDTPAPLRKLVVKIALPLLQIT